MSRLPPWTGRPGGATRAGDGAKGHRFYDWAWITLGEHGPHDRLLMRRSISDPTEPAFYRCWATGPVALPTLVRVAGARWSIEECLQATENEVGLDHYQVRRHSLVPARHPGHDRTCPPGFPRRPCRHTGAHSRTNVVSVHGFP